MRQNAKGRAARRAEYLAGREYQIVYDKSLGLAAYKLLLELLPVEGLHITDLERQVIIDTTAEGYAKVQEYLVTLQSVKASLQ